MDIENLIYETLSSLECPVRYGWYDENMQSTHVTYFIIQEVADESLDDELETLAYTVQVDVWSMSDDDKKIKKQIIKKMRAQGFGFEDSADLFETDTKIYHKAMRFNYIEEVEPWGNQEEQ